MGKISCYLTQTKGLKETVANQISAKIEKHADICQECEYWIENGVYTDENPVKSEGFTAEQISSMAPFLDGVGAYSFLVSLREDPRGSLEYMKKGFPRK